MELNAKFSKRVLVHADQVAWKPSPIKGVSRRMLDRLGDEVARATTIVRYDANSKFSPHVHSGGEEFIVLEGVFQDEHGDFPAGSYVRNPPESRHTPGSASGCVIFVKLWQFDLNDRTGVRIKFDDQKTAIVPGRPGVEVVPLHHDAREDVRIEYWAPNAEIEIDDEGGIELLVLNGELRESDDALGKHSWLRLPIGAKVQAKSGPQGAQVWVKSGHLRFVEKPMTS